MLINADWDIAASKTREYWDKWWETLDLLTQPDATRIINGRGFLSVSLPSFIRYRLRAALDLSTGFREYLDKAELIADLERTEQFLRDRTWRDRAKRTDVDREDDSENQNENGKEENEKSARTSWTKKLKKLVKYGVLNAEYLFNWRSVATMYLQWLRLRDVWDNALPSGTVPVESNFESLHNSVKGGSSNVTTVGPNEFASRVRNSELRSSFQKYNDAQRMGADSWKRTIFELCTSDGVDLDFEGFREALGGTYAAGGGDDDQSS